MTVSTQGEKKRALLTSYGSVQELPLLHHRLPLWVFCPTRSSSPCHHLYFFLLAVFLQKMPLDGHSYLVSQGWRGKGTGLRDGAISRPITVAQKKNLAGLGKDRDEAFPFWDQ